MYFNILARDRYQQFLADTIKGTEKMLDDFHALSKYYYAVADLAQPSVMPVYWQAVPQFFSSEEIVQKRYWRLGGNYMNSIIELFAAGEGITETALGLELDESMDFFTHAHSISAFSDEALNKWGDFTTEVWDRLEVAA